MSLLPIQKLRFQNIFNPEPAPTYNQPFINQDAMAPLPTQPTPAQPEYDVAGRMKELYTPETAAGDRFNTLSQNQPTYRPQGKLRSLAAALISATQGSKAGTNALMSEYNHETEAWKQAMAPAQQAANLEKSNNANERMLAHQTITSELAGKRDDARNKYNDENLKIREDRAQVYRLKSLRPNMKFDFSGPTVMITDPATGKVENTGIKTGNLSDADKIELQSEKAIEQINERGIEAGILEDKRQDGRTNLAETRGWQIYNVPDGNGGTKAVKINAITGEVKDVASGGPVARPSTGGSSRGELPTQTKVRQYNAAKEFALRNPALGKYIKFGKGNEFKVVDPRKPSTGGFADYFTPNGPTPEEHAQITAAIFGNQIPVQQPSRTGADTPSTTATPTPPAKPTTAPTNRPTTPPAGNTATAPPAGAKPGGRWIQTKYGRVYQEPD